MTRSEITKAAWAKRRYEEARCAAMSVLLTMHDIEGEAARTVRASDRGKYGFAFNREHAGIGCNELLVVRIRATADRSGMVYRTNVLENMERFVYDVIEVHLAG